MILQKVQLCKTHRTYERRVGVGRADILHAVELAVLGQVLLGVKIGIAPIVVGNAAPMVMAPTAVRCCRGQRRRRVGGTQVLLVMGMESATQGHRRWRLRRRCCGRRRGE